MKTTVKNLDKGTYGMTANMKKLLVDVINMNMKMLNLYKHYVVRDGEMLEINKNEIKEDEPILYIGSTPSTPPDVEFIFGYKRNGEFDWVNGEISYEIGYLYDDHSKNKLIEMSKQINN